MGRHHTAFLELISKELGCSPAEIIDADICLMDAVPGNLCGLYEEIISCPRIDNLLSTWAAFQGICDFAATSKIPDAEDIAIAVSFDHEECGSQSFTGADGDTFPKWLDRIMAGLSVPRET